MAYQPAATPMCDRDEFSQSSKKNNLWCDITRNVLLRYWYDIVFIYVYIYDAFPIYNYEV